MLDERLQEQRPEFETRLTRQGVGHGWGVRGKSGDGGREGM